MNLPAFRWMPWPLPGKPHLRLAGEVVGILILADDTLPPDHAEFRNSDGSLAGQINGLGLPKP